MQQAQIQIKNMVEKLNHMSSDRLAEINDFIDFIQQRDLDYIPNAETIEAIKELENDKGELKTYKSADDLFDDLGIEL